MWRTSSSPRIPGLVDPSSHFTEVVILSCVEIFKGTPPASQKLGFLLWTRQKCETSRVAFHVLSGDCEIGNLTRCLTISFTWLYIPSYLCIPGLARVKIREARPLLNWKQGLFCSYHVMTSSRVSRCHGTVKMSCVMTLFVLKHDWQRCHVVIKMEWHCNMFSSNNRQEKHLDGASIKHSLSQWSDTTVVNYGRI